MAADPGGPERRGRSAGDGHDRFHFGQGAPLCGRRKRGASFHAIGRSRGGRTTKFHLLVDEAAGRPRVVQLSPGQASDIVAAHDLIVATRPSLSLLADRAYALRRLLIERGTTPVIPNKINRVNRRPFDPAAFDEGVDRGLADPALTAALFSVRTAGLDGRLAPSAAPDHLSGLLIGAEIAGAGGGFAGPVHLIGAPALNDRYGRALTRAGRASTPVDPEAAVTRGLWRLWKETA